MQIEIEESSVDEIESSTDPEDEDTDNEQGTQVDFTVKPIPDFEDVIGDLFQARERRKKPYAYALALCISGDAAMSQGIAVEFCKQFEDLRRRVESESSVKRVKLSRRWSFGL